MSRHSKATENYIKLLLSCDVFQKKYSKQDPLLESFVKIFFSESLIEDLKIYSQEFLIKMALESLKFSRDKKKSPFKIRIHNITDADSETKEKHNYTIVDIVSKNTPFLLDSIIIEIERLGHEIKHIFHPIINVERDKDNVIKSIAEVDDYNFYQIKGKTDESFIQIHLKTIFSKKEINDLEKNLIEIIKTKNDVVADWQKMVRKIREAKRQIPIIKGREVEIEEVKKFLTWCEDKNIILLGFIERYFKKEDSKIKMHEDYETALGIYRSTNPEIRPRHLSMKSDDIKKFIESPFIIEVIKSSKKSRIHRNAHMERIRVQRFDEKSNIIGEYSFMGLFTSIVYYQSPSLIPMVRKKIAKVIDQVGFTKESHNMKDLISIIDSYPRDELFQISQEELLDVCVSIVSLSGRSAVRLFVRNDKFERFVSCLVYVPKERFNTGFRYKAQKILSDLYNGEITAHYAQISDDHLARLQVIVKTPDGIPNVNVKKAEEAIKKAAAIWSDDFEKALIERIGNEEKAMQLFKKYENAFSVSYTNRFTVNAACHDIKKIEEIIVNEDILFELYEGENQKKNVFRLKIYSLNKELTLSDIMPVLESFGFYIIDEHTYSLDLCEDDHKLTVWIHYFHVNVRQEKEIKIDDVKENFEEIMDKIWNGTTESGYLNQLVINASFDWKKVFIVRAYLKYLYQIGFHYSQKYIASILIKYPEITKLIIELFFVRFDPHKSFGGKKEKIRKIEYDIDEMMKDISDVVEDRVIRKILNIINATLRTNFFIRQNKDGSEKNFISFKFNSSKIDDLPLPRPFREIFVYSRDVEAIHLRGGKVARGGIRWSDRAEDYRTEVLGLMKAQMTKNAVIVPVGSKGGFIIKKDLSNLKREEVIDEAKKHYKTFLRGLLDLTDNIVDGKVIKPKSVKCHDGEDTYLVVAADKGTATFSDVANSVSEEYKFWLGDAFASGGSAGYDHKEMGITAKGAWVSVKRHFMEMGMDVQKDSITIAGIGDMSGDVFGNGLLLSKSVKLVAAFNHMHIFIDPNPDCQKSYNERLRLFKKPRSSWEDYNKKLLSPGGGVFLRSSKSIKLSKEIKHLLDIKSNDIAPDNLIKAILKAKIDLLWNGGIGTYVKSESESHESVGDRANDNLRVNGCELRFKVVGEGGNLGFTQKGRIEFAVNGGRINTDAMDNSAGVDCSDHEVNIKIALGAAVAAKKITIEQRNKILEEMSDEVESLVLRDNKLQTQAISISRWGEYSSLDAQSRFIDSLEQKDLLNRKVEFLPDRKEFDLLYSSKKGLRRPELCVLLSYAKMDVYHSVLESKLARDKYFINDLFMYFPARMQKQFNDEIKNHVLYSEIVSTVITNSIVNRVGITFFDHIVEDTGMNSIDIAKAYIIVRDSFSLPDLWDRIESYDGKIDYRYQIEAFVDIKNFIERCVLWFLKNQPHPLDITDSVNRFKPSIDKIKESLETMIAPASKAACRKFYKKYKNSNFDQKLKKDLSALAVLPSACDIAISVENYELPIQILGKIYFSVGNDLDLSWMRSMLISMSFDNFWEKSSIRNIVEELYIYQREITSDVVRFVCKQDSCDPNNAFKMWANHHKKVIERFKNFTLNLKSHTNPDISMFIVALNRVKALAVL